MDIKMFKLLISLYFCVIVSVSLNIQPVFGETADILNILNDIRTELENVKLINERNEARIVQLETQVSECNLKYAELYKEAATEAHNSRRLADIEYNMEYKYQELVKRMNAFEIFRTVERTKDDIVTSSENKLNTVDTDKVTSDQKLTKTNGRRSVINNRIIPVTGLPVTRIAFTSYISKHLSGNGGEQTLPFDNVETNEGHGFDPVTHVFTCPVSGVYYFAHSLVTAQERLMTKIVRDGAILAYVMSGNMF